MPLSLGGDSVLGFGEVPVSPVRIYYLFPRRSVIMHPITQEWTCLLVNESLFHIHSRSFFLSLSLSQSLSRPPLLLYLFNTFKLKFTF